MALFRKKDDIHGAAHVKGNTVGTSNEVSFSVLDAAKQEADGDKQKLTDHGLGTIRLFSMSGRRKPRSTPTKDEGLLLESGEFLPASGESSAEAEALVSAVQGSSDTGLPILVESSDMLNSSRSDKGKSGGGIGGIGGIGGGSKSSKSTKGGTTNFSSQPQYSTEISSRKQRRKRGKIVGIVIGVAACVALVCVGGLAISRTVDISNEQSGTVRGALQNVVKADKVLMEVDALVSAPLSKDSVGDINRVIADIPAAEKQLESALSVVNSIAQDAQVNSDKDAANNAITSISARLDMLESGQKLLEEASSAFDAMSYVEEAWAILLKADIEARLSIDMVSKSTDSSAIAAAYEKETAALVEMRSALTLIYDAKKLFPDVELTPVVDYLEKRIASLEHAVNATLALKNEEADVASRESEAYNTTDAEAAELAKNIPTDATKIVYDAYCTAAQPYIDAYQTARTQAGISDQPLRTYLSKS